MANRFGGTDPLGPPRERLDQRRAGVLNIHMDHAIYSRQSRPPLLELSDLLEIAIREHGPTARSTRQLQQAMEAERVRMRRQREQSGEPTIGGFEAHTSRMPVGLSANL